MSVSAGATSVAADVAPGSRDGAAAADRGRWGAQKG